MRPLCAILAIAAGALHGGALAQGPAAGLVPFVIEGDAIHAPLTAEPGNAQRGLAIVTNTNEGACVLCHAVPGTTQRFMGNVAPTFEGAGARLSPAQIRLRVVDATRVNPNTPMPSYYRVEGLNRVAQAYRGKPVLSAQQVEDVVAWLSSLKTPPAKSR